MSYMLDTNTCILAIKKNQNVFTKINEHLSDGLYISTIVLSELEYGISHSKKSYQQKNRIALIYFLAIIDILDYGCDAALEYGILRDDLQKRKCVIGNMDMLIAGHAKAENMVLVTHNTKEFSRVNGLIIEDWLL